MQNFECCFLVCYIPVLELFTAYKYHHYMAFTMIATSDIHLGRNSSRLPRPQYAELGPTTAALGQISDAAFQYDVDAVIIAGDLIDGSNHFLEVYDALDRFFRTLLEQEIHVILTTGNHDFDTLHEFINHWNPPDTNAEIVLLSEQNGWDTITLTNKEGSEAAQFIGWSFQSAHFREDPVALLDADGITRNVPTVALLHGDIYSRDSAYAPLNLDRIKRFDVQGWILGHIHKPDVIHPAQPLVCYPGSPQPLSPKETGEHYLELITCAPNNQVTREAVAPPPFLYSDVEIRLSGDIDPDAIRSHCVTRITNMEWDKLCVVRVILTGTFKNLERIRELQAELADTMFGNSYIHSVENLVEPALNLKELAQQKNPVGILAKALLDLKADQPNPFLASFKKQLIKKQEKIDHSGTFGLLEQVSLGEDSDLPEEDITMTRLIKQTLSTMLYELHHQKKEVNSA